MGHAEVIVGARIGPGRLLITAPGSTENGNRGIFFNVVVFPRADCPNYIFLGMI